MIFLSLKVSILIVDEKLVVKKDKINMSNPFICPIVLIKPVLLNSYPSSEQTHALYQHYDDLFFHGFLPVLFIFRCRQKHMPVTCKHKIWLQLSSSCKY